MFIQKYALQWIGFNHKIGNCFCNFDIFVILHLCNFDIFLESSLEISQTRKDISNILMILVIYDIVHKFFMKQIATINYGVILINTSLFTKTPRVKGSDKFKSL